MKGNIFTLMVSILLLSGCMQKPTDFFDPMAAASETGVDVTALPDIGLPTASDDGIITYDYSAAEGDRITERKFSGVAEEVLDGQGAWFSVVPAAGGTFTGNVDIGDNTTSTETRSLQIGDGRTGTGYSWIDLVGDTTYTNYGLRIARQNNDDENSDSYLYHRGTGVFGFYAYEVASIIFYTDSTEQGRFPSAGGFKLANGVSINEFSIDGTLAGDSDDVVPTEKSVKEYVDDLVVPIGIAASDESTALLTGTAKVTFRMPFAMTLTEVRANVNTAATGGTLLTVDINEDGSTILTTKLTLDSGEETSTTAATPAVIGGAGPALADDAEITIDIDDVGSTVAGKGLKVWLIGTRD